MRRGHEAANLGRLGLGAAQQLPTGHGAAPARGWGTERAESGLTHGHRSESQPAASPFPGLQTLCSSDPRSPDTSRSTWRVLPTVLHLKGLLRTVERDRIVPRFAGIVSTEREDFLRVELGCSDCGGKEVGEIYFEATIWRIKAGSHLAPF